MSPKIAFGDTTLMCFHQLEQQGRPATLKSTIARNIPAWITL
jgi:hypothetical protein